MGGFAPEEPPLEEPPDLDDAAALEGRDALLAALYSPDLATDFIRVASSSVMVLLWLFTAIFNFSQIAKMSLFSRSNSFDSS